MVVARFAGATGVYSASAVCYAPHLIDYTARAVAVQAERQHRARRLRARSPRSGRRTPRHAGRHVRPARRRDAARLRQQHGLPAAPTRPRRPVSRSARTACGIDGLGYDGTVTDRHAGRPLLRRGRRRSRTTASCVATTSGPDATAWVQRYTAAGAARRRLRRRPPRRARDIAARARGARATGPCWQPASRSTPQSPPIGRCTLARSSRRRGGRFGTRLARSRVAGGNNTGQAHRRAARRQHPRRRLRQPRRQDRVRAHALHGAAACATTPFGNHGETDDAVRNAGDQRLHHGHRPDRQHARRVGPADQRRRA